MNRQCIGALPGNLSLVLCLTVVGQCAQSEAEPRSSWLPWPASRMNEVYPEGVTSWPIPGYLPNYEVGYFRGAELLHRQPRTLDESAWSRNYAGPQRHRPALHRWWRGSGSHLSDGPRPWPFRWHP